MMQRACADRYFVFKAILDGLNHKQVIEAFKQNSDLGISLHLPLLFRIGT